MRTVAVAALLVALCSAQTAPRFDAVSIRPNTSDEHGGGMRPIAGGFSARNLSATMLIQTAYNVKVWQLSGGPGWTTSDRYDVEAKAAGNPTFEEKSRMLQPLLVDRFHLKFHRETRQMTIYSLTVAKNGSKLQSTPSDVRGYFRPGRGLFEGRSVNIKTLADFLAGTSGTAGYRQHRPDRRIRHQAGMGGQ
jgi:uncharacterized protein (TIGR03435 family)